jgi:hypothetical protein
MLVVEASMIGCRATRMSHMLAVLGVVALLSGCGPQQPMQRLGGTLLPTQTPLPGLAAPASPPGEPSAPQSETDDPTSPGIMSGEAGQWPDLLFANLFERARSRDGVYLPYLDLTSAALSVEGDWIYVTLHLAQAPVSGSGAHYSVEFDTDLDGRPDLLVTGYPRGGAAWDSRGMRAYLDTDKNVGGNRPRLAEPPMPEWDGFEIDRENTATATPPLIWLRLDPADSSAVQFAVSLWMLGAPENFAWRGWAEGSVFNPGKYEYNDSYSLEAAGSPYPASAYYPSQALAGIDNTCVMTFGFELEGPMPGYCGTELEPLPLGRLPPDDLVYAAGGAGVTLILSSGATQVIPGGILGVTPTP